MRLALLFAVLKRKRSRQTRHMHSIISNTTTTRLQYFVTQGLRYKVLMWFDPVIDTWEGKLMTFNLNKPSENPVELTLKNFNRTGFNPHGISVYRDPSSGAVSLFVVNHRPDAQAIEIFDFERETHSLIHRRSVVDELIWSPNNLYAVG